MFVYTLLCLVLIVRPRAAAPAGSAHLEGSARFWHITDLHLDPTYHVTSDPTEVCSSSKGSPASDAGPFGAFLCDSPYRLIQSAFSYMEPLVQPHDFIIWTGDSPPHVAPEQLSTDAVIHLIKNMTLTFRKHFPNTTVYPSIGNHDYWPQDQVPSFTNQIYRAAAELWGGWLEEDALLTLTEGGFYSQLVTPGLRVVSVNTILYYGPNKAVDNSSDPAGQFLWLEKTLAGAAQRLEKVFIIGHVPVGFLPYARNTTAIREEANQRLVTMYRKYSDVITGHFYGHTHRDSVMVLLNHRGEAVNSLFVSPAVTPIKDPEDPFSNNPGLRLYVYDRQDYGVMDIWQYYLNLTEANERRRSVWRLEYVMTEAFGLSDLRPHSLLKLGVDLMAPHSDAFLTYFTHFMVGYDSSFICEHACWINQDIWQYYLNLTEANERRRSVWRLEYVMTEAFGLSDLRPHSLLKLGVDLMAPHSDAFLTYFTHFMVGYDSSFICEHACWINQVCSYLYLDHEEYQRCVDLRGRATAGGGFYSQLVTPGLRVVSVNTILYYGPNKAVDNSSDPAGQFLWLEKTLAGAAQRLEKVFIIGQVPVGFLPYARNTTAIREEANQRLVTMYRKYSDVITGHFYGHTHRDSVMVLLNHRGEAVNSLFVSPAVTPIKHPEDPFSNNPGLRLYVYDRQDYGVMDIWQYYLNLTEANERRRSVWRLEYVMTEAFGLSDLRPHSLLKLGVDLMAPHSDAFLTYFTHFMVGYDSSFICEHACWINQVCSYLYLDHEEYQRCVDLRGRATAGGLSAGGRGEEKGGKEGGSGRK